MLLQEWFELEIYEYKVHTGFSFKNCTHLLQEFYAVYYNSVNAIRGKNSLRKWREGLSHTLMLTSKTPKFCKDNLTFFDTVLL